MNQFPTIEKLSRLFNDESIINVYEIKNKDLDHVLNILVRTNSGGKPLSSMMMRCGGCIEERKIVKTK